VPALLSIARHYVKTDLPLASAPELFAIVAKADLSHFPASRVRPDEVGLFDRRDVVRAEAGRGPQWTSTWMAPVKD
jgi:hypothetical protein